MADVGRIEFGPANESPSSLKKELKKCHEQENMFNPYSIMPDEVDCICSNPFYEKRINEDYHPRDSIRKDLKPIKNILKNLQLTEGGHPLFNQLLSEMSKLHASKNKDYAGTNPLSNFKMCEDIGIPAWKGTWIRMSDKWNRLKNIIANDMQVQVKSESLEDTLMDLSVYSLITLILLREERSGTPTETEEDR